MTLIIGLTGGIATGKSTVSSMLATFDVPIIDADKIARDVVKPGKSSYVEIVREFGSKILRKDRTINREELGKIIFANQEKRELLNSIVHPAIRKEMIKQRDDYVRSGVKSVVLDIPLLFESNLTTYVHKTVVVYVPQHIQLKRLIKRDCLSEEEALKRINSQIPISEKTKMADAVIDNSQTKEKTFQQIKSLLQDWKIL